MSAVIVFHIAAILGGALQANPASDLERAFGSLFAPYFQFTDQGHSYRYYAPDPGPTAVVTATIRYGDGRPDETVRLPERGVLPRLRYQRQLALANHLVSDFTAAKQESGDGGRSVWARSYARHLAKTRKGSTEVTLHTMAHLIPDPAEVAARLGSSNPVDIDSDEFYTTPERIGAFACDAF